MFQILKGSFITVALVVAFTASVVISSASGDAAMHDTNNHIRDGGSCGDNITWDFDRSTGTLTITGVGDMEDYLNRLYSPWYLCNILSLIETVVIEEGVTSIGNYAFYDCKNLVNVSIPSTVTHMGHDCFHTCTNLKSFDIPSTVKSIGDRAFYGCENLTSINIPSSLSTIPEYFCCGCISLTDITIPSSITIIGKGAFNGCSNLISITIPSSVTTIPPEFCYYCTSLKNVTLPLSITSIGGGSFSNCHNLESITLPFGVYGIGFHAFESCTNLKSITIPESITRIYDGAFQGCTNLKSVTLPRFISFIGMEAFRECTTLETITLPQGIDEIAEGLFKGCTNLKSINIPHGVTTIGNYSFLDCTNLSSVTIPSTVDKINVCAFDGCNNIKSLTYLGTSNICGFSNFSSKLDYICLPIDYSDQLFCGNYFSTDPEYNPTVNTTIIESIRGQHNKCNQAIICTNNEGFVQKRGHIDQWESGTTPCATYSCDNATGETYSFSCDDSDAVKWICLDDKCFERDKINHEGWVVDTNINNMNASEMDKSLFIREFCNASGVRIGDVKKVGIEANDNGYVTHIYVVVDDDETVTKMARFAESCHGSNYSERS